MSDKTEKTPLEPVSDEFDRAFVHGGNQVNTCDFCGRVCYAADGDCFEQGEFEELEANRAKNPDKYASIEGNSIGSGHAAGRTYISGCPCNGARAFEDILLSERRQILSFFKSEADSRRKALARDDAIFATLAAPGTEGGEE